MYKLLRHIICISKLSRHDLGIRNFHERNCVRVILFFITLILLTGSSLGQKELAAQYVRHSTHVRYPTHIINPHSPKFLACLFQHRRIVEFCGILCYWKECMRILMSIMYVFNVVISILDRFKLFLYSLT